MSSRLKHWAQNWNSWWYWQNKFKIETMCLKLKHWVWNWNIWFKTETLGSKLKQPMIWRINFETQTLGSKLKHLVQNWIMGSKLKHLMKNWNNWWHWQMYENSHCDNNAVLKKLAFIGFWTDPLVSDTKVSKLTNVLKPKISVIWQQFWPIGPK